MNFVWIVPALALVLIGTKECLKLLGTFGFEVPNAGTEWQ